MNKSELKKALKKEIESSFFYNGKVYILGKEARNKANENARNISDKIFELIKLDKIQKIL